MPPHALQEKLTELLNSPWDLVRRPVTINQLRLELIYLKGLVKEERMDEVIISPLKDFLASTGPDSTQNLFSTADVFASVFTTSTKTRTIESLEEATHLLLEGWTLLVPLESPFLTALYLPGWTRRKPQEPAGERCLRGPREGFTEDLLDNVTLIRRWIKDPNLRVEEKTIGKRTRTKVVLVFVADLASPALIAEVNKRLDAIEIDSVLESGYLEELITDERLTVFPLIQATERSDSMSPSPRSIQSSSRPISC